MRLYRKLDTLSKKRTKTTKKKMARDKNTFAQNVM